METEPGTRAALVTGASGIGASTVRRLASSGWAVAVADIDANALSTLGRDVTNLVTIHVDLTDADAGEEAVTTTIDRLGRLDAVINVVGISGRTYGDGAIHEATEAGWRTVLDTNLMTTVGVCASAVRHMRNQGRGGAIVNTTSVLAYAPNARFFETHAYAASKGAIIALTRAMASSYAPDAIRVNAVAPGLIATPMSVRAQHDPDILAYVADKQPLADGLGKPDDVADVIAFLIGNDARLVTGHVIEVAGGWSVRG